jgi:nitroimidazol reductase NimA-like FMN-containing flavoprotein (pyridoxamine 5'-phosphate oxidase superfamily)
MKLTDRNSSLVILPRDECLRLLAHEEVGRLAVIDGFHPRIFPVNYAMDAETIVIRTAPGTKLTFGTRTPVCFEIDHYDRSAREGWSVVVDGTLEEVTSMSAPDVQQSTREAGVEPWAAGAKDHWLRLGTTRMTGRRIEHRFQLSARPR